MVRAEHTIALPSFIREGDVPRMDIEQCVPGRLPKHLGHVQRVTPPIAKKLAQMVVMLLHDFLAEIRNFVRQFRAGEIEDKRALDDAKLKYAYRIE